MFPIADMFSKISNAQAVKKETAVIPYSKLKMEIAKAFLRSGYIKEINRRGKKNKKTIEIALAYDGKGGAAISRIIALSKPSCRVYLRLKEIRPTRGGRGITFLSTPKGILTDKEAVKEKVGGEAICKIW